MEIKAAQKVNGLSITKHCEMVITGILIIPFRLKGHEQERCIYAGTRKADTSNFWNEKMKWVIALIQTVGCRRVDEPSNPCGICDLGQGLGWFLDLILREHLEVQNVSGFGRSFPLLFQHNPSPLWAASSRCERPLHREAACQHFLQHLCDGWVQFGSSFVCLTHGGSGPEALGGDGVALFCSLFVFASKLNVNQ